MDSPFSVTGENLNYIEELYNSYLKNPESIAEEWRSYFRKHGLDSTEVITSEYHKQAETLMAEKAKSKNKNATAESSQVDPVKQVAVLQLINAYRFRGHRRANLDPLNQYERPKVPELSPEFHGLFREDMGKTFNTGSLQGVEEATLEEILNIVKSTYCQNIGAEYMHIVETSEKRWIQQRLEPQKGNGLLDDDRRKQLLRCLIAA
ncbi:uncharacterized protein METZ01_LOCUS388619, partial [marine metagenome]